MGDIINDLTGGFYKRGKNGIEPNKNKNKKNTYSIFIQFDDDESIEIFDDIENEDSVEFYISNTNDENSYIEFQCKTTGKKFKIYAK